MTLDTHVMKSSLKVVNYRLMEERHLTSRAVTSVTRKKPLSRRCQANKVNKVGPMKRADECGFVDLRWSVPILC